MENDGKNRGTVTEAFAGVISAKPLFQKKNACLFAFVLERSALVNQTPSAALSEHTRKRLGFKRQKITAWIEKYGAWSQSAQILNHHFRPSIES